MPSRHCFRPLAVAPRFCARHPAKNPPPAPSPPALASTAVLRSPAPPLVAVVNRSPCPLTARASGKARARSLPTPQPAPARSPLHSPAPPPPPRTPGFSSWHLSGLPLAAPFLLSVHLLTVSLLGCSTLPRLYPCSIWVGLSPE